MPNRKSQAGTKAEQGTIADVTKVSQTIAKPHVSSRYVLNENVVIGLWVNLSRAVEIAKAGNFTISIGISSDYIEGFNDYKMIKDFYKGFFENFVEEGDLFVEIYKPDNYNLKHSCESKNDIQHRINESFKYDITDLTLSTASESLIKTATYRLSFSLKDVELIRSIAVVIAKLSYSTTIKIEHVAEAIQYRARLTDKWISPENETVNFGMKVKINYGEIDSLCAKEAIAYLNQFV